MWRLGTSGIVCPLPTTPSGVSQLCASEDRAVLSQAKSMVNGLAHPGFKCEQTDCEQTVSKLTDQQFPNHPHFPLTLPVTHMLIHITSNLGIFVLVPTTGRKEHTIFHFSGKEWLPFIYPEAALLKFQWFSPGQAPWGVCGEPVSVHPDFTFTISENVIPDHLTPFFLVPSVLISQSFLCL